MSRECAEVTGTGRDQRRWERKKEEKKTANPVQFCHLTCRISSLPSPPLRRAARQTPTGKPGRRVACCKLAFPGPLSAALRIYAAASRTDVLRRRMTLTSPSAPKTPPSATATPFSSPFPLLLRTEVQVNCKTVNK